MKIIYFIDHLRPDGTQYVLKQLVRGLAKRGHDQTIICLNDSWDKALVNELRGYGSKLSIIGKLPLATGFGLQRINRILLQGQFEVAVTLLFASDVIGRWLAHKAGVPRIVTSIQTRDEFYTPWQRWLVRKTMPWANCVLLNSRYVREFAVNEEGAPPDRLCLIPNSIRVQDYRDPPQGTSLRQELNLPENSKLLGSIGRLTCQKGFDVLLQALALLHRDDLHLVIAGKGEEEKNLRTLASSLGVAPQVTFLGYRRDIAAILHSLDLYVHASRYEGMPIAVLEAMAAARPIVASAVDGNLELIQPGVHGWLTPPEDAQALADAIGAALRNPAEAHRRAFAARQRAIDQFDEDKIILEWEKAFLGTLPCSPL